MVDIRYSQNFYTNKRNLERLVKLANITERDTVLDIGAGKGVITEELLKYSKKVLAYELDNEYFDRLTNRFSQCPNVLLKREDFLNTSLPKGEYKVFSNIPFSITSDIINKITNTDSRLKEAFLFVQKESAERFMGTPRNTQISAILSFMYEMGIVEEFRKEDFTPTPSVDIVLLNLKRKDFQKAEFLLYRDFVTYIFNQMNSSVFDTFKQLLTYNQLRFVKKYLNENRYSKPTDIPSDFYINIFDKFKGNGSKYIKRVKGYYLKHLKQHTKREKTNRRRV